MYNISAYRESLSTFSLHAWGCTGGVKGKICETLERQEHKWGGRRVGLECLEQDHKVKSYRWEGKKGRDMRRPLQGHTASGKSLKLTGNSGENCFSQSPKTASNSSPSGRASKSMPCRKWWIPMSSRLLWIKTTKLLMSLYKKQHSIHWLSFKLFIFLTIISLC